MVALLPVQSGLSPPARGGRWCDDAVCAVVTTVVCVEVTYMLLTHVSMCGLVCVCVHLVTYCFQKYQIMQSIDDTSLCLRVMMSSCLIIISNLK